MSRRWHVEETTLCSCWKMGKCILVAWTPKVNWGMTVKEASQVSLIFLDVFQTLLRLVVWEDERSCFVLIALELEQLTELKIMWDNAVMMLNNICWLWKAEAEQHGWGDRSAQFVWEMHQNRVERRWSQGKFCYLALCWLFVKGKRGPWVTSVFGVVFPIALHCISCSVIVGNFLVYIKEETHEYSCGEQTLFWPRAFINFVLPSWSSLVNLRLRAFLVLKVIVALCSPD